MSAIKTIAAQLGIPARQIEATVRLLDDGNTVPFIARYRKEATGGLSDEQVQHIADALRRQRAVDERRAAIRKAIEGQGHLTPVLAQALDDALTLTDLEDLYAPFRPKRETRADRARAQGLLPLAVMLLRQPTDAPDIHAIAFDFLKPATPTAAHVWQGARDIVAELLADNARVRQAFRRRALGNGRLRVTRNADTADPNAVYALYYDFDQPVAALRPHQVLAINRGEKEKILRVQLALSEHDILLAIRTGARPNPASTLHDELQIAIDDALKRLILPAIERDVRRELTERAEAHAIDVFGKNLADLLSQPPIAGQTVLAIDPGYRTGCKVAVVDPTGRLLETATIYPHKPQEKHDDALKRLAVLLRRHAVTLIAIGNGTASRETELLVAELTRSFAGVHYLMVNEAGASVYSASALARQELPDLDVALRGAVSIGRRAQDPLAELVKIEPQSIGVGLYQHDVNQKQLGEALDGVVTLVVNRVGVDLNTASPALLTYVAGIGPKLAEKIVAHRDENGPFANRSQLHKISGLGPKTFEQCAGFLRIRDSSNELDATAIHPESYPVAIALLKRTAIAIGDNEAAKRAALGTLPPVAQLAQELGVGVPTLEDIIEQIVRPGRDPRSDLTPPLLRSDVLTIDDLQPGQRLHGTVRNVVDFGAFIDIGVKRDGLLHRSAVPRNVTLTVGQVLEVLVKEVDTARARISLDWAA